MSSVSSTLTLRPASPTAHPPPFHYVSSNPDITCPPFHLKEKQQQHIDTNILYLQYMHFSSQPVRWEEVTIVSLWCLISTLTHMYVFNTVAFRHETHTYTQDPFSLADIYADKHDMACRNMAHNYFWDCHPKENNSFKTATVCFKPLHGNHPDNCLLARAVPKKAKCF